MLIEVVSLVDLIESDNIDSFFDRLDRFLIADDGNIIAGGLRGGKFDIFDKHHESIHRSRGIQGGQTE